MSRIQRLLDELCTEGIPEFALSELASIATGAKPNEDSRSGGLSFPFINGGVKSSELLSDFNTDAGTVVIPSRGSVGIVGFLRKPFWCGPLSYRIRSFNQSELLNPFLYYFLKSRESQIVALQQSGSIPALNKKELAQFKVPVPPIKVQEEIVRILDAFTELEAELEAELQAELQAREKQYKHFRSLVMADKSTTRSALLGDLVIVRNSLRRPVTRDARQPGPYPYFGANGVQDWVSGYIFDGEYLLLGEDGSVINADGTPVVNWLSGKAWVNNHAHVLEAADSAVNLRFIYYFLSQASVSEFVTGGSQKKINQGNLVKIPVQLPSRSRQNDIVEFLDKFSTLLGDISLGLPGELIARRKQYEHYRDQLLTFKVAS